MKQIKYNLILICTIVGTIIAGATFYYTFWNPSVSKDSDNSDCTTDISEVLSKAHSFDIAIEQGDFLKKYIGHQICGTGTVEQISRVGDDFLVDIKERNGQIIACKQDRGEGRERHLILLKGKKVRFTGVFTNHRIADVGLNGVTVDSCVLERR